MSSMFYEKKSGNQICKKSAKTDQAKNPQDIGSSLAAKSAQLYPLKKFSVLFRFASTFLLNFAYFLLVFGSDFSLVKQIFGSCSFRFVFFAKFSLIFRSFSLHILAVSLRCESSEIMSFFRLQAKRNFRFNSNFRFRSENEGAPYM